MIRFLEMVILNQQACSMTKVDGAKTVTLSAKHEY